MTKFRCGWAFTATLLLCAQPGAADDAAGALDVGGDAFRAGANVTLQDDGVDDLFAAAARVNVAADISGNAHLAGRRVLAEGAVGGDLYAAGMTVIATGPVAGDATLMGYEVQVGEVGGDLRASGAEVTVAGDVAGYAILAGDTVRLEGSIAGDAHIAASDLDLRRGATIAGTLTLYEDTPGALDVPEAVAGTVLRRDISEWDAEVTEALPSGRSLFARYLGGVVLVTVLAALVAALMPETLARLRFTVLAQPMRTVWFGILSLSVLIGGAILSALTLIGLLASPALILGAVLLGFGGYVVGVYALGVGILGRLGRGVPADFTGRAIAAGIGALTAGAIALVPVLGWLAVLAIALSGAGAMTIALVRPRFFVPG